VTTNYAEYVGQNVTITGSVVPTGARTFKLKVVKRTSVIVSALAMQQVAYAL
jgi:hypothetical protein